MTDATVLGLCSDNVVSILHVAPSTGCLPCASPPSINKSGTYTANATNIYMLGPIAGLVTGYISISGVSTNATPVTIQLTSSSSWASTLFVPAGVSSTIINLPFHIVGNGEAISISVSDNGLVSGSFADSLVYSVLSGFC